MTNVIGHNDPATWRLLLLSALVVTSVTAWREANAFKPDEWVTEKLVLVEIEARLEVSKDREDQEAMRWGKVGAHALGGEKRRNVEIGFRDGIMEVFGKLEGGE